MLNNYTIQFHAYSKSEDIKCSFTLLRKTYPTNTYTILISKNPTGNPQISSIGYAYALLMAPKEDRIDILKECYKMTNYTPNLILIDVKKIHAPMIKETFKIIQERQYTSTNRSDMTLFITTLEK